MAIKSEDYLPKKAVSNPIPDGGCVYGFLYEYFPNIVRDKISSGDIYVKFRDVAGTEYRTKWLAKSEQDFENNIIFDLNKLKQN